MKNFFKISLLLLIVFSFLFLINPVQAQVDLGEENLTEFGEAAGYQETSLPQAIGRIVRIVLGLLGLIAVVIIIIAGIIWMTSGGSPEKIKKSKDIMFSALIGLLIIVFAYAIASFVIGLLTDIGETTPISGESGCTSGLCCGTNLRCDVDGECSIYDQSCSLPSDSFKIKKIETTHGGLQQNYHQDVYLCSAIQPIFNNQLDQNRFEYLESENEVRVERNGEIVEGYWSARRKVAIFKHEENFLKNTTYQSYFPKGIINKQSQMLQQCLASGDCQETSNYFIWTFETGETIDNVAPEVVATYPINQSDNDYPDRNISLKPSIEVSFSEPIDITTVADENNHPLSDNIWIAELDEDKEIKQVLDSDNFIVDVKNGNGFEIYLVDGFLFDSFTWYQIHVEGVEDLCLNSMEGVLEWDFQTNDRAPGIRSYYPEGEKVCPDENISVVFNTQMYDNLVRFKIQGAENLTFDLRASEIEEPYRKDVSGGVFRIEDPGDPINNNFRVFTFQPDNNLKTNANYQVEVLTDMVINVQGDLLSDSWTFKTATLEDCFCSPWISRVEPSQGKRGECLTLYGRCFKGTSYQLANPEKIEFEINGEITEAEIGGFGSKYLTTAVPEPESGPYQTGDRPQISTTIKYLSDEELIESNKVEFFLNSEEQASGPCLLSLNPDEGYSEETYVDMAGLRFGDQTGDSKVLFYHNKPADYEEWEEEEVNNSLVPQGAEQGLVYLENEQGRSNGLPFEVLSYSGGPGNLCQEENFCPLNPSYSCNEQVYNCLYEPTDNCRCCCIPSPDSCEAPLECITNQGDCTGDNRGLCCGCENDQQCGGETTGCGMLDENRCCYSRPFVEETNPSRSENNVCLNTGIEINFDQAMDKGSLKRSQIELLDQEGEPVDFSFIINQDNNQINIFPKGCLLDSETEYQVKLVGGEDGKGIRSALGVSMNDDSWTFTTGQEGNFCDVDTINVIPEQATVESLKEEIIYQAQGYDPAKNLICIPEFEWGSGDDKVAIVDPSQGLKTTVSAVGGKGEQTINISAMFNAKVGLAEFTSILSPPIISEINPNNGTNHPDIPTYVTIQGENFGSRQNNSLIKFGETEAAIGCQNWSDNQIIAIVPSELNFGNYQVKAVNPEQGISNGKNFEINNTFHPAICELIPSHGSTGDSLIVSGTNFGDIQGDSYVLFGKNSVDPQRIDNQDITSWSNERIKFTVPETPENKADVVVYVPSPIEQGYPLKESNSAIFYKEPIINKVSPEQGPKKTWITIQGNNFGSEVGEVYFKYKENDYLGNQLPSFCEQTWSNEQIIIEVPEALPNVAIGKDSYNLDIYVKTSEGLNSELFSWTLNKEPLGATICQIEPDQGPEGYSPVVIKGKRFDLAQEFFQIDFNEQFNYPDNIDWDGKGERDWILEGKEMDLEIIDNQLLISNNVPGPGYALISGSEEISQNYLETKIRPSDDDVIGIVFNFKDRSNSYIIEMLNDCYFEDPFPGPADADECKGNSGWFGIRLRKNGSVVDYYEDPEIYQKGEWVTMKVIKGSSGKIEVYLNEKKLIEYNDSNPLSGGRAGIYSSWHHNARFDYFKIGSLKEEPVDRKLIFNNNKEASLLNWASDEEINNIKVPIGAVSGPVKVQNKVKFNCQKVCHGFWFFGNCVGTLGPDEECEEKVVESNSINFEIGKLEGETEELPYVIEKSSCVDTLQSPSPRYLSQKVCPNILISARFNEEVVNLTSNNIEVKKCNLDEEREGFNIEDCNILVEGNISLKGFNEKGFIFTPKEELTTNYWYQVTLKSGENGIQNKDGKQLDGNKNGLSEDSPEDNYTWHFKIKDKKDKDCDPKIVKVLEDYSQEDIPGIIIGAGEKEYISLPIGLDCQILNPMYFNWDWNSTSESIATVTENDKISFQATAKSEGDILGETEIQALVLMEDESQDDITGSKKLIVTKYPEITETNPEDGDTNVCLNSLIKFSFDQKMDEKSFYPDKLKIYENNDSEWEDITDSVKISFFNEEIEDDEEIEEGEEDGDEEDEEEKQIITIVKINNGLLKKEKEYKIEVLGGDLEDEKLGVSNEYGLVMKENKEWTFTAGEEICHLSKIKIKPDEVFFTKSEEKEDLAATAYGAPSDGEENEITQIPGNYYWEWIWDSSDKSIVSIDPNDEKAEIEAQNKNGEVQVTAEAIPNIGDGVFESIKVDVFLCEVPWFYQDKSGPNSASNTNFKFYYCIDKLADIINEDEGTVEIIGEESLPELNNPAVIAGDGTELIKEFLFTISETGDAIGIKVFNNPKRLSSSEWYQKNVPNPGKPKHYTIDGYYAVQEGRTVYVSVPNREGNDIKTYVFVISYNNNAEEETIEIFDQLLSNWTFNINLDNPDPITDKNQIQNDLIRIQDLEEIKSALSSYYQKEARYPILEKGSFIKGKTNSLWPSWNNTLGAVLETELPVDPINKFNGPCSGCEDVSEQCNYTCYNPNTKEFNPPDGSHVYQYYTPEEEECIGFYYSLATNFEYGDGEEDLIWTGEENIVLLEDDKDVYYNYLYSSEEAPVCGNNILDCGEFCDNDIVPPPERMVCNENCDDWKCSQPYYADCNDSDIDGCEVDLRTNMEHCGSCSNKCEPKPETSVTCQDSECVYTCESDFDNCDGNYLSNGCEAYLPLDINNCGSCGNQCNQKPNSSVVCQGGECIYTCNSGWENCDSNWSNGCEVYLPSNVNNCGACGNNCEDLPRVELAICNSGNCGIDRCEPKYDDCDGSSDNGCEADLTRDENCGRCGNNCNNNHAIGSCIETWGTIGSAKVGIYTCLYSGCEQDWGNCNHNWSDGCETSLITNNNCGACGKNCNNLPYVDLVTCHNGDCIIDDCESGYSNCDDDPDNGCEANLRIDINNCGACGKNCNNLPNVDTVTCNIGNCFIVSCDSGYRDCDDDSDNGCEANLRIDINNCGACGKNCNNLPYVDLVTCHNGDCIIDDCESGYSNCDDDPDNGCEANLRIDINNCGACGNECMTAAKSIRGYCDNGICYQDCIPGYFYFHGECIKEIEPLPI